MDLNAAEGALMFAAFLSARPEKISVGETEGAGPLVEAYNEFCKRAGLEEPREEALNSFPPLKPKSD